MGGPSRDRGDEGEEGAQRLSSRDALVGAAHAVQLAKVGSPTVQLAAQSIGVLDAAKVASDVARGETVRPIDAASAAASVTLASGLASPAVQAGATLVAGIGAADAAQRALNTFDDERARPATATQFNTRIQDRSAELSNYADHSMSREQARIAVREDLQAIATMQGRSRQAALGTVGRIAESQQAYRERLQQADPGVASQALAEAQRQRDRIAQSQAEYRAAPEGIATAPQAARLHIEVAQAEAQHDEWRAGRSYAEMRPLGAEPAAATTTEDRSRGYNVPLVDDTKTARDRAEYLRTRNEAPVMSIAAEMKVREAMESGNPEAVKAARTQARDRFELENKVLGSMPTADFKAFHKEATEGSYSKADELLNAAVASYSRARAPSERSSTWHERHSTNASNEELGRALGPSLGTRTRQDEEYGFVLETDMKRFPSPLIAGPTEASTYASLGEKVRAVGIDTSHPMRRHLHADMIKAIEVLSGERSSGNVIEPATAPQRVAETRATPESARDVPPLPDVPREARDTASSNTLRSVGDTAAKRPAHPPLEDRFNIVKTGLLEKEYHFRDQAGKVAFVEKMFSFYTTTDSPAAIKAMVDRAAERGWQTVSLKGSPEFVRQGWIAANAHGLKAVGHTPTQADRDTANKERARLEASRNGEGSRQQHDVTAGAQIERVERVERAERARAAPGPIEQRQLATAIEKALVDGNVAPEIRGQVRELLAAEGARRLARGERFKVPVYDARAPRARAKTIAAGPQRLGDRERSR